MLNVTRLLNGTPSKGDALRYGLHGAGSPYPPPRKPGEKKPIVVWNITRRCNLHCMHCYSNSYDRPFSGELTTKEGLKVIDDLTEFQVPVLLFSGGEPLTRSDVFRLAAHASAQGLRCSLSTNGTLITREMARKIREAGFGYVGVSLDGIGAVHDKIRGFKGAFDASLQGIRNCQEAGLKVGVRFTVHRKNKDQLPALFNLLEEKDIPRFCIYHLAYAGRGSRIRSFDLRPRETRQVVDCIFSQVRDLHHRGIQKEVLTVDNHADNAYLYMNVQREQPARAQEVYEMLRWNGGNQSGIAIACIDPLGNVHPDQFWWHYSLGNVKERPFGDIWTDTSDPLMARLKDRKAFLKGRCARCRYLDICNGNLRVRSEVVYGDVWAEDPACYLTDEEIGIA